MPWCPNCKTEYQEGFTRCTDCKVPLVDKLEEVEEAEIFIPFLQAEEQKVADKLASFFEYSGLHCKTRYDEETESYIVDIPPDMEKDARKLYQAFYIVEAELAAKEAHKAKYASAEVAEEDSSEVTDLEESEEYADQESDANDSDYLEDDDSVDETDFIDDGPSDDISSFEGNKGGEEAVYIMKSDQYKDLTGTVYIFLIFGIGGLIFVLLNVANIVNVFNGWLPNTVMGVLFILFIYIAFSSSRKAKAIKSEIDAENLLTRDINNWMKENVTESFLASIHNEDISIEANYIHYVDVIKEMLIKEFGQQNLAYLDRLIEEFYNKNFDESVAE